MDLFNKEKVKSLERKLSSAESENRYNQTCIKSMQERLNKYEKYIPTNDWFEKRYTLLDAENEINELKLYVSILEGEIGLEKIELAKQKFEALKKLVDSSWKGYNDKN